MRRAKNPAPMAQSERVWGGTAVSVYPSIVSEITRFVKAKNKMEGMKWTKNM